MASVGNTPLIRIGQVFAKLECVNPCGSIKDRVAQYIIDESERLGKLKPGMQIVEASSGNTGIALSYFAKIKGYPITIVMPENMSEERKNILRKLGANLILCSEEGSFAEAAQIRDEIAQDSNYFNPDQFSNALNVECHQRTTGQEILSQLNGQTDQVGAFVAGVGTGGSLIGVGQALKQVFPNIKIVAVEPTESAVMSGGAPSTHGIQGIGDGFVPALAANDNGGLHSLIDDVICVSTETAKAGADRLQEKHQLCVGVSSGANFLAAQQLTESFGTVVTLLPDGYEKYQSQGLKACKSGRCDHANQCAPWLKQLNIS